VTTAFATTSDDVERNSLAPLGGIVPIAAELSFNTRWLQSLTLVRSAAVGYFGSDVGISKQIEQQN
jgi:hypothetical protein